MKWQIFGISLGIISFCGMGAGSWTIYASARDGAPITDTLVGIVMLMISTMVFSSIITQALLH